MDRNDGISSYQNMQFETMSPARLIQLLFEKLLKELQRAKACIQEKNIEGKGEAISKSQEVLMELLNSLNLDVGQIAHNLQALYLYMFRELNYVNLHLDLKKLNVVVRIVEDLKSAWEEITNPKSERTSVIEERRQESKTVVVAG